MHEDSTTVVRCAIGVTVLFFVFLKQKSEDKLRGCCEGRVVKIPGVSHSIKRIMCKRDEVKNAGWLELVKMSVISTNSNRFVRKGSEPD